jgi:4-oxalocrotonate tautomerase
MPMIKVEMFPGRTKEQKRAFAKAVTEAFVTHCNGTPQSVQIIFQDVAKEDWATAGKLASDPVEASPVSKTA